MFTKYTEETLKDLENAANQGNSEAMIKLGNYWADGNDLFGADYGKALKYYRDAEAAGNPEALRYLADMYREGHGVELDESHAFNLLQRAADAGSPMAKFELAYEYLDGSNCVEQDKEHAEKLFIEAATDYNDLACDLVSLYLNRAPEFLGFNPEAAEAWARKFFDTHRDKKFASLDLAEIARIYEDGDGLPANPGKALQLYREIAKYNGEAALRLGVIYEEGRGIPVNFGEAVKYYRLSDRSEAEIRLGKVLFFGKPGVPANPAEGAKLLLARKDACTAELKASLESYYRPLAEAGDTDAQFGLSELLFEIRRKDEPHFRTQAARNKHEAEIFAQSESAKWARLAAENGHLDAQYSLFEKLHEAFPKEAAMWREKAANANHKTALLSLAFAYEFGEKRFGIRKNLKNAIRIYEKLITLGERHYCRLAWCYSDLKAWEKAAEYFNLATEETLRESPLYPNAIPLLALAKCYAKGRGVPKSAHEAARLLKIASLGEDGWDARIAYADALWNGIGVPQDRQKAVVLYRREAKLEPYPQLRLAWAYLIGDGVESRSLLNAFREFRQATGKYLQQIKNRIRHSFKKAT